MPKFNYLLRCMETFNSSLIQDFWCDLIEFLKTNNQHIIDACYHNPAICPLIAQLIWSNNDPIDIAKNLKGQSDFLSLIDEDVNNIKLYLWEENFQRFLTEIKKSTQSLIDAVFSLVTGYTWGTYLYLISGNDHIKEYLNQTERLIVDSLENSENLIHDTNKECPLYNSNNNRNLNAVAELGHSFITQLCDYHPIRRW